MTLTFDYNFLLTHFFPTLFLQEKVHWGVINLSFDNLTSIAFIIFHLDSCIYLLYIFYQVLDRFIFIFSPIGCRFFFVYFVNFFRLYLICCHFLLFEFHGLRFDKKLCKYAEVVNICPTEEYMRTVLKMTRPTGL